jgi:O-acetylhomoserine (thiol)-lyase
MSTSFVFESSEHAASLFNMERAGHVYSRISNPTNAVLEERVAALEGGVGAIATASGQAALHLAIATIAGAGSHIVASAALYGGSHNLLHYTLPRFGIETTFVKPRDLDAGAPRSARTRGCCSARRSATRARRARHPALSAIAHDTACRCWSTRRSRRRTCMQPFALGADLALHSATKFLSGTARSSAACSSTAAASTGTGKAASRADRAVRGFHDMVFSEESTVGAFLLRARREGLRDFGACMSPHTAWLILQGIETLSLRMERHVANARRIVEFLAAHPLVAHVGIRSSSRIPTMRLPPPAAARLRLGVQLRSPRQSRPGRGVHRGVASSSRTSRTSATAARW